MIKAIKEIFKSKYKKGQIINYKGTDDEGFDLTPYTLEIVEVRKVTLVVRIVDTKALRIILKE